MWSTVVVNWSQRQTWLSTWTSDLVFVSPPLCCVHRKQCQIYSLWCDLVCFSFDVNATFSNISHLLGEETGETTDLSQVTDKLYHNVVSSTSSHERDSNSLVVIDTNCTDSCKTNHYTITVMMAPTRWVFEHTIYCTGYDNFQYYTNEALLCNVNTK